MTDAVRVCEKCGATEGLESYGHWCGTCGGGPRTLLCPKCKPPEFKIRFGPPPELPKAFRRLRPGKPVATPVSLRTLRWGLPKLAIPPRPILDRP